MKAQSPAGVIFDLEGTLVDFQWKIAEAVAEVKEKIGEWSWTAPLADIRDYAQLYNTGIKIAPGPGEKTRFLTVINEIYDTYDKDALTRWEPQPFARELLEALKAKQTPIALCSNVGRKAMDGVLLLYGWNRRFDVSLSRNEVRFLKPEPEGLERTIELLRLSPKEVLFIGDSQTDIRAARKVGCHVAVAAQGESTRRELATLEPDHLLASLEPLMGILKVDEA